MCVCEAAKNYWKEEGGKEEGLEVGSNTFTPLKTFSYFFLWHVIFRFTILIMMILERRVGEEEGEDDGRRMRLFTLSLLFFLLLHFAWREGGRNGERGGLLND